MWHVFPRNKTLLGKVKSSKTVMAMANVRHTPWRSTFEGHGHGFGMNFHSISVKLLWYFYGISMVFLWYFYGISMVFLWYFYDISMGLLWDLDLFHGWLVVGFNLPTPLKNHGVISQLGWWFFPLWWESHVIQSWQPVCTRDFMETMEDLDGIFIEYPLVN